MMVVVPSVPEVAGWIAKTCLCHNPTPGFVVYQRVVDLGAIEPRCHGLVQILQRDIAEVWLVNLLSNQNQPCHPRCLLRHVVNIPGVSEGMHVAKEGLSNSILKLIRDLFLGIPSSLKQGDLHRPRVAHNAKHLTLHAPEEAMDPCLNFDVSLWHLRVMVMHREHQKPAIFLLNCEEAVVLDRIWRLHNMRMGWVNVRGDAPLHRNRAAIISVSLSLGCAAEGRGWCIGLLAGLKPALGSVPNHLLGHHWRSTLAVFFFAFGACITPLLHVQHHRFSSDAFFGRKMAQVTEEELALRVVRRKYLGMEPVFDVQLVRGPVVVEFGVGRRGVAQIPGEWNVACVGVKDREERVFRNVGNANEPLVTLPSEDCRDFPLCPGAFEAPVDTRERPDSPHLPGVVRQFGISVRLIKQCDAVVRPQFWSLVAFKLHRNVRRTTDQI
mmetsp:Transcript_22148/g.54195  ORF Transcript_22148/g.54195 Transcript_22148/m.54195 type:complete len:439 (+) Transcript_22148:1380-2696(+)